MRRSRLGYFLSLLKETFQQLRAESMMKDLEEALEPRHPRDGNWIYWPNKPVMYFGRPISFHFYTGMNTAFIGRTMKFQPFAIPLPHARLAAKVLAELPRLLPLIDERIIAYDPEYYGDNDARRTLLSEPKVEFYSHVDGYYKPSAWTFHVAEKRSCMWISADFENLNLIEVSRSS